MFKCKRSSFNISEGFPNFSESFLVSSGISYTNCGFLCAPAVSLPKQAIAGLWLLRVFPHGNFGPVQSPALAKNPSDASFAFKLVHNNMQ
jgi:hypothetical protein